MKIRFLGWKKVMIKIEFIQLLHHSGVSLNEAKSIKDNVVHGEIIEICCLYFFTKSDQDPLSPKHATYPIRDFLTLLFKIR